MQICSINYKVARLPLKGNSSKKKMNFVFCELRDCLVPNFVNFY